MAGARASGLKKRKASMQKRRKLAPVAVKTNAVQTDAFSIGRPIQSNLGFGQKVTMIYSETFQLNAGVGGLASEQFRANSCYDPLVAVGGHQPRGFDQLMALYKWGTVIGSKIDVGYMNLASGPVNVAVCLRDDATPSTTFNDVLETPATSWTITSATGAGGGVGSLSQKVGVARFMGRKSIMSEDNLRFSAASDAPDQCYYHIYTGDPAGGDPAAIWFQVRIEYTVILTEPRLPGQS